MHGVLHVYVMLRIQRSSGSRVLLTLSGHIEVEDAAELERLVSLETPGEEVALDLRDVTLVDRDAVKFLARLEAGKVKLENCPAYIMGWIDTERGRASRPEG